jgi:hypothetical protein
MRWEVTRNPRERSAGAYAEEQVISHLSATSCNKNLLRVYSRIAIASNVKGRLRWELACE